MSKVLQGQGFLDMVIQLTGTPDTALETAILNAVSITEDLPIGKELTGTGVVKRAVVMYLQENNLPATAISDFDNSDIVEQFGIGAMVIEENFIVR